MRKEMAPIEALIRDLDKQYFTEEEVNVFLDGGEAEIALALKTLEERQTQLNGQIQSAIDHRLEDDSDIQNLQDELIVINQKIAALSPFVTPENKVL